MTTWQRIQIALGRIFLVLLFISIALSTAEWIARRTSENLTMSMIQTGRAAHVPKPYVMFSGSPYLKGYNELGYPGPLPVLPKPKNEFRILLFGGSTVVESPNGKTLAQILTEELSSKLKANVQVYTFGAVSSVSRQDLVRFVLEGIAYQPDMTLFYNGGNDLLPFFDRRPNYPHRFFLYELNPATTPNVQDYQWLVSMALGSQLARKMFEKWIYNSLFVEPALTTNRSYEELDRLRAKAYVTNMHLAELFTSALKIHSLTILHPIPMKNSHTAELYKYARAEIPGPNTIDLSDFFASESKSAFVDGDHLSPDAHAKVSMALAEKMIPIVRKAQLQRAPIYNLPPETDFIVEAIRGF